jgi:uncharacterized membrane protein YhaH (DUF805 family)
MNLASLLFSFEGRINRAKYWLATLISIVGAMLLLMIALDALADAFRGADPERLATLFPIFFYAIAYPLCTVLLWVLAATTVKRLRDRDRNGWWIVPLMVVPIALPNVGARLGEPNTAFVLGLLALALSLWSFVELFCLSGTRGPNRFGPDPRDRADSTVPAVSHGLA